MYTCLLHVHETSERVCICTSVPSLACVGSTRIRRVLCGPCRRAFLTPFEKNLGELAAGLLPKVDGSLKLIIEHVNISRLREEELPSFDGSSSVLAVQLLWHALNSLCTCQRVCTRACVQARKSNAGTAKQPLCRASTTRLP